MKKVLFTMCMFIFPLIVFADTVCVTDAPVETCDNANKYTTQDAAREALTEGKVLTFLEDSETNWQLTGLKNVKIELNGYTVQKILVGGTASISNGKTTGGVNELSIYTDGVANVSNIIINTSASVMEKAEATFTNVECKGSLNTSGDLTIKSGTYSDGISVIDGNLEIKNGTFTSSSRPIIELASNTTATIDGGSFSGSKTFLRMSDKSKVTINGGSYDGSGSIFSSVGNPTIDINGGTLTSTNTNAILHGGTINFNSGKIIANSQETLGLLVGSEFNFGKKSDNPSKDDPIFEMRKGKISILSSNLHFYGGTMYLKESIPTDNYKSEVKLYDLVYEKQSDNSYKAYLKSSKPVETTPVTTGPVEEPKEEPSSPLPTYSCKKVDDKFYDKNGNVVSKVEFQKACPEEVPDLGIGVPIISVIILAGGAIVLKKRKNILNRV